MIESLKAYTFTCQLIWSIQEPTQIHLKMGQGEYKDPIHDGGSLKELEATL